MDVDRYLERIAYRGPLRPDPSSLAALHEAHMLRVPFENLSIHTGERIKLDPEWLHRKIVERGRGGFCYELNGLFACLLEELGFKVTRLSARVKKENGAGYGPPFDHLVLRVDLDEPWLADVGFGRSFLRPLRLFTGEEQRQQGRAYRIVPDGMDLVLQNRSGEWLPQYRFSLEPHSLDEYAAMCVHHQTSPDSTFTRQWFATLATRDGRVTLHPQGEQYRLVTTTEGRRRVTTIIGAESADIILEEMFGLHLQGKRSRRRQG